MAYESIYITLARLPVPLVTYPERAGEGVILQKGLFCGDGKYVVLSLWREGAGQVEVF
jgi:hypothetical protein